MSNDAPQGDPEIEQKARRLRTGRNSPKAGRALGELGPRALPALRDALGSENAFVRSGALHGFAAVVPSNPESLSPIAGALASDLDPRVRETACMMLGQLGADAVALARTQLEQAVTDPDERVRNAAAKALQPATT